MSHGKPCACSPTCCPGMNSIFPASVQSQQGFLNMWILIQAPIGVQHMADRHVHIPYSTVGFFLRRLFLFSVTSSSSYKVKSQCDRVQWYFRQWCTCSSLGKACFKMMSLSTKPVPQRNSLLQAVTVYEDSNWHEKENGFLEFIAEQWLQALKCCRKSSCHKQSCC